MRWPPGGGRLVVGELDASVVRVGDLLPGAGRHGFAVEVVSAGLAVGQDSPALVTGWGATGGAGDGECLLGPVAAGFAVELKLLTGPGCDAVAVVGVRVGTRERGQFGFGRLGAVTADLLGDVRGPNPLRVVGVVLVDRVERIVVGPVGAVRGLLPRVEVCGSDPAAVVFGGGTEQGEDVVVGDG